MLELNHPNCLFLRHYEEPGKNYLNVVLEFIPETFR